MYINERPHLVHNTYLEVLTDAGVIGLLLFMGVIVAALRAAYRASMLFERAGDRASAALSRSVLVAALAALTASLFLSNQTDPRTWVILTLAIGLLAAAQRLPDAH
jgi:O-antigen ligase